MALPVLHPHKPQQADSLLQSPYLDTMGIKIDKSLYCHPIPVDNNYSYNQSILSTYPSISLISRVPPGWLIGSEYLPTNEVASFEAADAVKGGVKIEAAAITELNTSRRVGDGLLTEKP